MALMSWKAYRNKKYSWSKHENMKIVEDKRMQRERIASGFFKVCKTNHYQDRSSLLSSVSCASDWTSERLKHNQRSQGVFYSYLTPDGELNNMVACWGTRHMIQSKQPADAVYWSTSCSAGWHGALQSYWYSLNIFQCNLILHCFLFLFVLGRRDKGEQDKILCDRSTQSCAKLQHWSKRMHNFQHFSKKQQTKHAKQM